MANPWPDDLQLTCDVPAMFGQDGADQVVMVGRAMRPGIINSVEFIANWPLSGTDTNYRTLTLYNRGTGGAGTTAVATLALTSGVNLTKFVPKAIPVTAGNGTLAVGDLLEWVSTATLTGAPDVGGKVIVQHSLGT